MGVDFRGEKIGMNDFFVALLVPQLRVILDHVESERYDQIGVIDCQRATVLAAESNGVKAIIGVHVDTSFGHKCADDTDAGLLAENSQLLAGTFTDAAVTCEDDWTFCFLEHRERAIDDFLVGHRTSKTSRCHRDFVRFHAGDIFGQLNVNRTGFLGSCDAHGLANDLRNGVGIQYRRRPFGDRLEHAHHIHDLVRFLV